MLDSKLTLETFGYSIESISIGSSKKVCVHCDYCSGLYHVSYKNFHNSHKDINKDACNKCKYIKRKEICLLKYSVENSSQRPEVKAKISKSANYQHLLDNNPMQTEEGKLNHIKSIQSNYGVNNVFSIPEIKEKRKQSLIDKYGEDYMSGLRKDFLLKNNNQNPGQIYKDKIQNTLNSRYGGHHSNDPKILAKITNNSKSAKIANGSIKQYNNKTIPELALESGFSRSHMLNLIKKYGFDKAITMKPYESSLETCMQSILDEFNIFYIKQYKIQNRFADFFIPDFNLIIECDGLYWHSDAILEDKYYHFNKKELYNSLGYTSLFFRENEIYNTTEIIKSIILNKLNLSNRIFARNTIIKEVDKSTAKQFFLDNHLMGPGRGRAIGLYYNNTLVSLIQIHKNEISRFCHIINNVVVGGFSKLVKYINTPLSTFIDSRYGSGEYLYNLGFTKISNNISFRWTDTKTTFHRMKFKSNTGYKHGLYKIWDCGQIKYSM